MDKETFNKFREQLVGVAQTILAKGKATGWDPQFISWETDESGNDTGRSSMSVISKAAEDGKKYRFYASCDRDKCVVREVSLIDPDMFNG